MARTDKYEFLQLGDGSIACTFPSDGSFIADLYDCVEFVSALDLTSSGYSDKADGICCPNRGLFLFSPHINNFQRLPVFSPQPLVRIQQNLAGGIMPLQEFASSFCGIRRLPDRESIRRIILEQLNTVKAFAVIVSFLFP